MAEANDKSGSPVRHIVLWKLSDRAEGSPGRKNGETIKERLEALNGKIPGLRRLAVEPACVEGGYDLCLIADFDSREALEGYRTDPLHVEVQGFVHKVITERAACDIAL